LRLEFSEDSNKHDDFDVIFQIKKLIILMKYIRTNSDNPDFIALVKKLDLDLEIRDGKDHAFYAQFNKTNTIKYVIVAYDDELPVGCGAIREYNEDTIEVKRMYVEANYRKQGIASKILKELEQWAVELKFTTCILETGKNQPEAIHLYKKNNYSIIPNYGNYLNMDNSICFYKKT